MEDWLVILIATGIFLALGLVPVPFTIICKKHGGTVRTFTILSAICMWSMWLFIYLSQMNPLIKPKRAESEGGCSIQ